MMWLIFSAKKLKREMHSELRLVHARRGTGRVPHPFVAMPPAETDPSPGDAEGRCSVWGLLFTLGRDAVTAPPKGVRWPDPASELLLGYL